LMQGRVLRQSETRLWASLFLTYSFLLINFYFGEFAGKLTAKLQFNIQNKIISLDFFTIKPYYYSGVILMISN